MLCSTIIPSVGRATLSRSVTSALKQNLSPEAHEVIVVNDSGKPLPECDWMKSPQVVVAVTYHSGVCAACNTGAALAKGKYLNFLHDDDYLLPGGLRALVETAEQSDSVWVYGGQRIVDDAGDLVAIAGGAQEGNLFAFFVVCEILHASQSLLRRDAFLAVGGFDSSIRLAEDRDLEWRMALIGRFSYCGAIVACIRAAIGSGSTFREGTDTYVWHRRIRERALNADGAFERLQDSVDSNPALRGRVARGYAFSAVHNLAARRVCLSASRLTCALRLAGWYPVLPAFWHGVLHRKTRSRPGGVRCG
jgi:glycosyltransferase involved in cell wall biosynthesis